jgi:hypothetical protein
MERIKKYVLMAFLFACGLYSQAQTSTLPKGFSDGSFVCYVRTGLSLNCVTGSGVDDVKTEWVTNKINGEFKNTLGGLLNVGVDMPLGISPFYYGMSVSLAMRGYKTTEKWKDGANKLEGQEKLTAFCAQLSPVIIGYIAKLTDHIALDPHIGLYFSTDIAGIFSDELSYSDNTKDKKTTDISDKEDYNRYDAGICGGIGLWYNHWFVDISYQRGIASMKKADDYCSTKLLFSVGYAF